MKDYEKYIDDIGLIEAEKKMSKGDYKGYTIQLQEIFEKIKRYSGDKMPPIHFRNEVKSKIALMTTTYDLSKSTFIRGKQCEKSLFLNKYEKKSKDKLAPERKALFQAGREFENNFRSTLGKGVNLSDKLKWDFQFYPYFTKFLLEQKEQLIFEAGFIFDRILVLVDVLQRNQDGSSTIYEVKNSSKIKEVHYMDMALQYYVIKETLKDIKAFNIVIRDNNQGFMIVDIKNELIKRINDLNSDIIQFKKILVSKELPQIAMGNHCNFPYECDFKGYCSGTLNSEK